MARALDVSERTIRDWIKREGGRSGRPPRSEAERRRAFIRVVRTWRAIGRRRGWRPVSAALRGVVPVRLAQECLSAAKRLDRSHAGRRRIHVVVLARDVMWHLDAAHLGRAGSSEVQSQVLRDAAQSSVLAATAGGPVDAKDAERIVAAAIEANGAAPLVLATDNGPPYVAGGFEDFLASHRIVHLLNLPHTPQHNARAERAIRDVKEESGLGRGVRFTHPREVTVPLASACARLGMLAGRDTRPVCAYTEDQRDRFYAAVCRRIGDAVQCTPGARARRMAQREAIHAELEERGLIRRTRGGAQMPATKAEVNS